MCLLAQISGYAFHILRVSLNLLFVANLFSPVLFEVFILYFLNHFISIMSLV